MSSRDGERIFDLAAEHGLEPELLAELLALLDEGDSRARSDQAPGGSPRHLRKLALLGRGGTAEVWRAHDERLDRPVAMKILLPELTDHAEARDRFVREASVTARLAHPGVVPVHEIGTLADSRPFFTMDVVTGRTLDEVLASEERRDEAELRRLVGVFRRAVDAVAYAHTLGVVHRDLKPSNIMVGGFGSVFVLDWGLYRPTALVAAADELPADRATKVRARQVGAGPAKRAASSASEGGGTLFGAVLGTPGYLSPEQAAGREPGPHSDTYALGLILWEILHGRPAIDTTDPAEAARLARAGRVPPCEQGPEALREVVRRATTSDPAARFPDAGALVDVLARWLDGEERRGRAQALVDAASALVEEERALRAASTEEARAAAAWLEGVAAHAPASAKRVGWARQDAARDLARRADATQLRRLQMLHSALSQDPEHGDALRALADHWHRVHVDAEHRRDAAAAEQAEAQLAFYDRGRFDAYLEGSGSLEVTTEPPGAEVVLFPQVERDRQLVDGPPRPLGTTPCRGIGLPAGSYLVHVSRAEESRRPGEAGMVLPVHIRRGGHTAPPAVVLAHAESLGPEECLVPAGPFWSGAPGLGFQSRPWREEWVEAFVMARHPVTQREYLHFVNELVAAGREEDALRWAPRERGVRPDQPGALCYARDEAGRFALAPDADGDLWNPRWPVFLVDHASATAYADWLARRTGLPYRLPTELEWEKAARGVDGRSYPWGDRFDPSFACVRASHPGRPVPAPVDAFPADVSVYGVRGMAGNMRDWCAGTFRDEDAGDPAAPRVLKGGCWFFPESGAHLAARYGLEGHNRGDTVSFRLARSLDGAT